MLSLTKLKNNKKKKKKNKGVVIVILKSKCTSVLERWGYSKGIKSKPRFELWNIIAENIPIANLRLEVRTALKK
ncbi:hypothetical protein J4W08_14730, partial [Escherichia coli]